MIVGVPGRRPGMEHDPRPRYLAAGALFLVGALVTLIAGEPLLTLLLAVVAAVLFYWMTRVKSVP
jgi:Flp pilus assembly protein TadB